MKPTLIDSGYIYNERALIWIRPSYPGIAYSDGDEVEERIASIIDNASDLSVLSAELRQYCTDWPSLYHLSGTRANILRPLEPDLCSDVLEVGAGCGAITRYLGERGGEVFALEGSPRRAAIARARTRDLKNVEVVCDKFDDFGCEKKFDVVTLIGVLEYANLFSTGTNPTVSVLERSRSFLKPNGKLIIAIENQLGLKYFAGAEEDHTGIPMYGIEGHYREDQPHTFGLRVLSNLITKAGFPTAEFLAPFPDYKLPVSIVTERGFSCNGFDAAALAWQSVRRDPQLPRMMAFSPECVWPTIVNNGLALDLANSFLIVASPNVCPNIIPTDILAWHFTTDRKREFCKLAEFVQLETNQVEVRYKRVELTAANFVEGSLLRHYLPERDAYRPGKTFSYEFMRVVTRDGWRTEEICAILRKLLDVLALMAAEKGQACDLSTPSSRLPGDFFDYIPQNLITSDDLCFHVIDTEWTATEELELGYIVFRSLLALINSVTKFGRSAEDSDSTYRGFVLRIMSGMGWSLSDEDINRWLTLELKAQAEVSGRMTDPKELMSWLTNAALPMNNLNQAVTERDSQIASLSSQLDAAVAVRRSMEDSVSWRLTRPFRLIARIARHRLANQDLHLVRQELSTRFQRLPLPDPAKKLVRFAYHRIFRKGFRLLRRQIFRLKRFQPPLFKPDSQSQNVPDYLVWGVIDWHFRHQRPQHLALALSASGRRVFYISPVLVDEERVGFEAEPLDASRKLFQIRLFAKGAPSIYADAPSLENVAQLKGSIGEVLVWANSGQMVALVDHPYWYPTASVLPNSRLIYDCMDHHEGFSSNADSLVQLEKQLLSKAELTVTTSAWLDEAIAPHAKHRVLIRNACEYAHFAGVPANIYRDPQGRRVVGYYGAIAEWFDVALVEAVAKQHPDCSVLLIGTDTVDARSKLAKQHNVTFAGEVPYGELPYYLHGFDVCLLPFKVVPLTLATNPVKVYEYLSAGKPVVTIDLPEMRQFEGLVYVAVDRSAFLLRVAKVLNEPDSHLLVDERKAFAKGQTWRHRVETLIQHAESHAQDPKVSVIVVSYNNIQLTRACLESIDSYSQYEHLEIVVVDNASSDGTQVFLNEWASNGQNRRLILNEENRGFAAANNQGLAVAEGEFLVLLNNDTYVTPGWIRTLVGHLQRDRTIGVIGPVTNNIGNEAKIDIVYDSMDEMHLKSAAFTHRNLGRTQPLRTAAFFCVMMSREVCNRVGPLDEAFGRGFFEDDDYCRRVAQLGLRIVCAEDVFIHHHLSASFNKLKQQERQQLFENNKKVFEAKWGSWAPHAYRREESPLDWQNEIVPVFSGHKYITGHCVVCGKDGRFFYRDIALWRESLNCQHCRSTSRYRSIARGVLRAVNELTGVDASSLATLPCTSSKRLSVYDTQPPFYYETCAYPLPDMLNACGWIDVKLSQYKPKRKLGEVLTKGVINQNLECLTFGDASLDIVITSDVMEHVRLDDRAHHEIYRVLKPGGIYLFTVPHNRAWEKTLTRVQVIDPDDRSKDVYLLEPEYHGDANSDEGAGALAYRTYGRDLDAVLTGVGFEVGYERIDDQAIAVMNTELFYCKALVH
jgi:GT2 family glycosyltransferase/SAM-dependent methyltransferase/glycosyltransferase involved in cell wall biosynthesis